jgi:hypothetical protein
MSFVEQLTNLLLNERDDYTIDQEFDKNEWNTTCDILVFAVFNCNVYDKKNNCWIESGKCHLHYGCNSSKELDLLCKKYGYDWEWVYPGVAGFFKWKNKM